MERDGKLVLLIVPYGIETSMSADHLSLLIELLIVPYGIETLFFLCKLLVRRHF